MTAQMIAAIAKGNGSAKFASFVYTAKGTGEVAKVTLILGATTETLYNRDVAILTEMVPTLDGIEKVAAMEILNSRIQSLAKGIGNNDDYTCADVYVNLENVKGVRIHKDTGEVYVSGLIENKTVIQTGTYKTVNSSAKTLAKRAIEKTLPSGRFRLYKLGNVARAALNGEVLEMEVAA
jgi:hypothetical protein